MDSTSWIGLIFGILVSVWANRRGYAWWAYILASPIIGVIAFSFATGALSSIISNYDSTEAKLKERIATLNQIR